MLLWLERRACKHRGCEASLNHLGWGRVLGCSLGSCFSGSFFWSFFGVRSFGSCFLVRSSRGSCFLVRSFGVRVLGLMRVFFRCL